MTILRDQVSWIARTLADSWEKVTVTADEPRKFTPQSLFGEPVDCGYCSVVEVHGLGRGHRFAARTTLTEDDRLWNTTYFKIVFILDHTCNNLRVGATQ